MQICGGTTRLIRRRRFTFVLVGQARYFNIAELKLSNQTFENHQPIRAVDSIVVDVGRASSFRTRTQAPGFCDWHAGIMLHRPTPDPWDR